MHSCSVITGMYFIVRKCATYVIHMQYMYGDFLEYYTCNSYTSNTRTEKHMQYTCNTAA